MVKNLNILIADDHPLFRSGLQDALKCVIRNVNIYLASNGEEALNLIDQKVIHIIFLDISMPILNGIETAKVIRTKHPNLKIIMLSVLANPQTISFLKGIGVNAYMLKDIELNDLKLVINYVLKSKGFFCTQISRTTYQIDPCNSEKSQHYNTNIITAREKEILTLLCREHSVDEIANRLFLSPHTVKRHKQILFEKTNSKNLVGLVMFAIKNDIFTP